jgi:Peptidase family S41
MSRCKLVSLGVIVACASPSPSRPHAASPTALAGPIATAPPFASPAPAPGPSASSAGWLEDLDALEHHMGRHYANLEWNQATAGRALDLVALDRSTRTALRAARTDVEATDALARFVQAFRDAHLVWSSPLPATDYDLRLTSDGDKVAVKLAGPDACELKRGDEIDTIEGEPALAQLASRLALGSSGNEARRRDTALRTFTSSPFAPRERLGLTVRRGGGAASCTLLPRTAATTSEPPPPTRTTPGEAACAAFGIAPAVPPALPFLFHPARHARFRPSSSAESDPASGILQLGAGRTLGWLRIPAFSNEAFPAVCARAWMQFRARLDRSCGDACRDEFLDRFLPQRLVETIADRLQALRRAGVSGTVIDITDNGGGTDWTSDVVRMVSQGPLLCPAVASVREPAAVDRLDRELAGQHTCDGAALDPRSRRALTTEQAWTQLVRDDAAQPCDLGGVFRGEPPSPSCSLLTRMRRSPCDREPAPPGAAKLPDACTVFQPRAASAKRRAVAVAPVYVLINRGTGSAAEFFAAVLRDNGAATLIGERTAGAGCGYIDGGSPITLSHSGMIVRMPNCARFRADGTNEVDGVTPDVVVPWTVDDLRQFDSYAEKILGNAGALFTPPRRP